MTVPGQTIGDKGPGCLGMVGLLVLTLVIVSVTAITIFVPIGPFFHADTGKTRACVLVHNIDGSSTPNCSHPIEVSP